MRGGVKQKDKEGGEGRKERVGRGRRVVGVGVWDGGAGVASCMSESFVSCPFGRNTFPTGNLQRSRRQH